MDQSVLGLDIGGANLKAALTNGTARARRFAFWKHPEQLASELTSLIAGMQFNSIALSMTAELCRCFETKRQGVRFILDAVAEVAEQTPVIVWGLDGRFHAFERIGELSNFFASNWLALATFAGRFANARRAVLIDVGSTTTDVVPIFEGRPAPVGRTDSTRLETGELIYTGVRRTPLCAILGHRAMAEVFSTTLDVYLLLGQVEENPDDVDTADGRPATRIYAHNRIARMIGGDGELTKLETTNRLAKEIHDQQVQRIAESITRHGHGAVRIVSGSGEFLALKASRIEDFPVISLSERLGKDIASAACAYAVAVLAAEQLKSS